jgi:hypothetical protein
MDARTLKEWEDSLAAEAQAIREQIQSLTADLQKKTQQIELIQRLIESDGASSAQRGPHLAEPNLTTLIAEKATPSQVKNHVCEILEDFKRPMNINEIRTEFLRRGYPIPGKGTPFNILVHIGRELKLGRRARLQRTGRGTYSLRTRQSKAKP